MACRSGLSVDTVSSPTEATIPPAVGTDAGDPSDTDKDKDKDDTPPPPFLPLKGMTGTTGVQHGEISLAWVLPASTAGISKIVIVGKAGATISEADCVDPDAIMTTLLPPFEKSSWVDTTSSANGGLYSYAACSYDVATSTLQDFKKVEAVQARDLVVAGQPSQFGLVASGPTDGDVTLNIDFPADVSDLASFFLVMADGPAAPTDCSQPPVITYSSPAQFVSGSFTVPTGKTNGEIVSFRLCARDVSGNVSSSLTIAGTAPRDSASPPVLQGFSVINGGQGGYVDYAFTLPADPADYAQLEIKTLAGGLPAPDCSDGNVLVSQVPTFTTTGTAFTAGADTFGFRVCITDTSGNLTSSDVIAPFYVPGCDAGYYSDGTACVAVGAGHFSPIDTLARFLCDIGYYCATPTNGTGTGDGGCLAGYFCPAGSVSNQEENAGPGKFTTAAATVRSDCAVGRHCSTVNNTTDQGDGPCNAGYFCPAGSASPTQEDAGQGKYTTAGAIARSDCAAGSYCSTVNNTASSGDGLCSAGYFCLAGSPSPTQFASGAGYYTAGGASAAVDCGTGKFCPNAANTPADRTDCAAGRYCSTVNNTTDQGDGACTPGYYCPAGSTSATANNCPIGSYCPAASGAATACANKPNYSVYTTANWTTSTCPYSCNAGHTPSGGQCLPNCSITVGPATWTNSTTANFTISCTNIGTVQCSLDGGAYAACSTATSHSISGLSSASHTLNVRSTDGTITGNAATHTWNVDAVLPTVTITTSNTSSYSPNWVFSSGDTGGGSIVLRECKRDAQAYGACSSATTHSYSNLGLGSHTFTVRVTDSAGNTATDSRTWDYGTWYQTNNQLCSTRCSALGKSSVLSPEGAYCASGETMQTSTNGLISYTYGTWSGYGAWAGAASVNGRCYMSGQPQDNDATDTTVGCFCR